jgi:outer membrane protein
MKRKLCCTCNAVGAIVVSAMFLLAGPPAMAQDVDLTVAEAAHLQESVLGLGVAYVPDYEGSQDYEAAPLLQARFNWSNGMYFSLLGNTAKFNLIPSKGWQFGPLVRYRAERSDVDNARVDAMEDIDAAVEAGAFITYNPDNFILSLSAAQDLADAHDGYVIDLGAGYRFKMQQRSSLTLFAKTTYASEDYMDTYFGVSPADAARSGLSPYVADAEFKDAAVGLLMQHNFAGNWGVLGVIRYTKLLGDASDSPIVDVEGDDNQGLLGVLVNYRF